MRVNRSQSTVHDEWISKSSISVLINLYFLVEFLCLLLCFLLFRENFDLCDEEIVSFSGCGSSFTNSFYTRFIFSNVATENLVSFEWYTEFPACFSSIQRHHRDDYLQTCRLFWHYLD